MTLSVLLRLLKIGWSLLFLVFTVLVIIFSLQNDGMPNAEIFIIGILFVAAIMPWVKSDASVPNARRLKWIAIALMAFGIGTVLLAYLTMSSHIPAFDDCDKHRRFYQFCQINNWLVTEFGNTGLAIAQCFVGIFLAVDGVIVWRK